MSLDAQRIYLTKKMKLHDGDLEFPIGYPNHAFDQPKNAPYGEFFIISGPKPVIMGGEGTGKVRVRHVGLVQLNVWIPEDKGTKIATVAGDAFKAAFQLKIGRDTAGSTYKFGVMQDFTPQTKQGWSCFVFRVPFDRDTVEAVQLTG